MPIVRLSVLLAAFATCATCGLATAGRAYAENNLNGHYQAVVDGSRSNALGGILMISTNCDSTGNCTGWVSTPKTWGAAINKSPGGSWTITRNDSQAWDCGNGGKAPADLVYSFAAANLAGSVTATKAAGACGDPTRPTATHSLQVQKCVDNPDQGVCP